MSFLFSGGSVLVKVILLELFVSLFFLILDLVAASITLSN